MYKSLKYLTITALLTATLQAGGFALSGVGARALSMGGAFRAVANDWSTLFWNPAGLAYIDDSQIALNGLGIRPSSSYEPNTGILGYDGPYSIREKVNTHPQNFYIPSFAYITPFEIAENRVAISFTVPFGLGSKWDLYDFPIGYYNTTDTTFIVPNYEKYDWQSDLSVYNIYLSYAKSFGKFSIGLSAGATRTSIMLRKVNFFDPATVDTSAHSLPIQYRLFPIDTKIEGTGWGFGGILGIMWKINEKLALGASARVYSKVKLEGTADLTLYFPYNDYLLSQMPPEKKFMFNGSTASGSGTFTTKLNLPANAGAGISYKPSEKLTLALDVDWTRWFTLDRLGVDFENLVLKVNNTIPLDTVKTDTLTLLWKNTYRVSFGGEYKVIPDLLLRYGLYWDQSPVPDNTITVLIPDPGDKYSVNLGLGYNWKNMEINLNYEYILPSRRTVERDSTYSYESPYLPGAYEMNIHGLGLNIVYKF
jgi:long-chain fatty acid transport protein